MKIHKLSLAVLVAAGLLAFSISASAADTNAPAAPAQTPPAGGGQGGQGGGRGRGFSVDAQMDRLTSDLSLTDEQKPKVRAIVEEQSKKMQEFRADTTMSQEDRRTKGAALREEMTNKLKGILTDDQFKKYQAMGMRGRGPGGARGPAGGASSTNAPAAQP